MDISDQIVVMNAGRVEQVGAPRELYDEPANEFVMGFIGEVNRLGHELVRPHDLELALEQNGETAPATVVRVVHLGFEVRVELTLGEGERIWVQTTRDRAEELELEAGQIVFLRKDAARSF